MKHIVPLLLVIATLLAACSSPTTETAAPVDQATEAVAYPGPQTVGLPTITPAYPSPSEGSASEGGAKVIINYKPINTDGNLTRANVFLELKDSEILVMESAPVQVNVLLKGNMPDPCHELRVIPTTDEANKRVDLEVYTLARKGGACITVLQPFEVTISLGSFSGGKYEVYANGEKLGDFDS